MKQITQYIKIIIFPVDNDQIYIVSIVHIAKIKPRFNIFPEESYNFDALS